MSHDKRLYIHTIEFRARLLDRKRLNEVLERNFGARQIKVRSVATKRDLKAIAPHPNWTPKPGSVGARILALLSDGAVHARVEILRLVPDKSCVGTITRLRDLGAIVSPAWGYYAKAGANISGFERPAFDPERLGPAMRRMLDELEQPKSAVELKDILGGTRQAIEQKLKKLRQMKLIRRIDALGERGRHVYLKADARADQILLGRPPVLRDTAARLLSLIPPEASSSLADVIGTGNLATSQRNIMRSLVRQGLIEWSGTRNKRVVRLTNLGREHPQYDPAAPKAPPLRETLVSTDSLRLLLAIHALGEARSIDLTLALNLGRRRKRGGGTGQLIQRLEETGFVEAIGKPAGSKRGRHLPYRLTPAGVSYVTTVRGEIEFPDDATLRATLERERALYVEEQKHRAPAPGFQVDNRRYLAILDALRDHGPLATTAINSRLPDPYTDPRSINLAMRTLLDRGQVVVLQDHDRRTKQPIIWGLPTKKPELQTPHPANDDLSVQLPPRTGE